MPRTAPFKMTTGRARLVWLLMAAVLGAAMPAVFAGFSRWSRTRWVEAVRSHWVWGLLLALPVGFFAVRTVL